MTTEFRLTLIGDSAVGKTSILSRYTKNNFTLNNTLPTICNDYHIKFIYDDNNEYKLHINDTGGTEGYENIRRLSFYNVDCFVLCFAINSRNSFDNIIPSWISAIQILCNDYKLILVGTKSDLREKRPKECVNSKDIHKMVKEINACAYVECSAYNNVGIDDIFQIAIKNILN